MFSVGCILVEFFTGDALFQTHDNLEHLAMMDVVMGKMPVAIARKAKWVCPSRSFDHRIAVLMVKFRLPLSEHKRESSSKEW
jgi:hypothetical protein